MTEGMRPKTLGAKRETRGERSLSQSWPPQWSQEECQGRDSSSGVPGSLALTGEASRSSEREPTVIEAAIPGAAAVTLHPVPQ